VARVALDQYLYLLDRAETRWIIKSMIEHDLYHAGEINRMRALRQENDRWAYDQSITQSE
jgi:hypothetical protein